MKSMKRSANILYCVAMCYWFAQYAYTPYVNPELSLLGTTMSFMGFVSGIYGFAQLVLRLPLGILADRLQKQKLFICIGCFLCMLSSVTVLLAAQYPWSYLVCRGLAGMAAASWVSFTVLYSSYFTPEQSTSAITLLNIGNQSGRLLGFVFSSSLVTRFGSQSAFVISAVAGGVAFILSLFIKDVKTDREPLAVSQLATVMRDRTLLTTTFLAIMLQAITFSTVYSFTSNYAVSIGATQSQLSVMHIALIIPYILGNYAAGMYLMKRFHYRWLLFWGFLMMAVYCVAVPWIHTMPLLYAAQGLAGLGIGWVLPVLMGSCVKEIEPSKKTTAMGFFQAIYGIGMTAGPILMGLIVDSSQLSTGFYFIGVVAVATAFLALKLAKKNPA